MFNQQPPAGSVVAPNNGQSFAPPTPGSVPPGMGTPVSSQPFIAPEPEHKNNTHSLILTVLLILMTIVAIVFVYLFIQKYTDWYNVSQDVDNQINVAIQAAVAENTIKREEECAKKLETPYRTFLGPADYGSLSFSYPNTWSLYVSQDARSGGDYVAYFNPIQIEPITSTSVNALRVSIHNVSFEAFVNTYNSRVASGLMTSQTTTLGGAVANVYRGWLPSGNLRGAVAIIRVRDKTILLQTDAEIFIDQFYALLDTVSLIP